MFGFLKKDKKKSLQKKYEKLMQESFELSKTDRAASDQRRADAEAALKEIESLPAQ